MKADTQIPRRFNNLQDFVALLERRGRLRRISDPVSLVHEVTEIHRRVLAQEGPALLFEKPIDAQGNTHAGIVNLTATKTHHDAGRVFWSRSGDFRP